MSAAELTTTEEAVQHLLRVIQRDGRVAYLLGSGTETFSLLTKAHAEMIGEDVEAFRQRLWANCRPERVVRAEEDQ